MKNLKCFPALLFIATFIVSIGFSFYTNISPHVDAKAYNHIGWNLARGVGYIENEELTNRREDEAIFRVGPGYEFFLAGIYKIVGTQLEKGSAYAPYAPRPYTFKLAWQITWIVQAFLRMLTAFLLFKIALLLFSDHPKKEWVGLASAAIFGFFPDLILINGFLLYETLLLFLSTAAVYFSLKILSASKSNIQCFQSTLNVGFASLFWALAILTRPSELLSFLIFPVALSVQKNWRGALVSFLFPLLLVGGWSLRNSLLYDQPLFTTTAGAYALWVGNNEHATGGYDRTPELKETRNQYHSTIFSSIALKRVAQFAKEKPLKFVELQMRKTVMYFSLIRPTGFWPEFENAPIKRLLIVSSSALSAALLFLGGAAGIWIIRKKKNALLPALYGFMLAKPFAVIPFYVETRYRYSLYPLLALTAAFFIINFVTSSHRATFVHILTGAFAVFLIITSIDAWYSLDIIVNRLPILLHILWQ